MYAHTHQSMFMWTSLRVMKSYTSLLSAHPYADQTHNFLQAIAVELLILCVALYAYLWKTPFFTHGVEVLVYFLPYYFTAVLPTGTALNWKRTLPDPVSPLSKFWRICGSQNETTHSLQHHYQMKCKYNLSPDPDPAFSPNNKIRHSEGFS